MSDPLFLFLTVCQRHNPFDSWPFEHNELDMTSNKSNSSESVNNPQSGQGRPLPKKEADLFKNVVKFYESKQYKTGLKNAETILKRFPNHGETLCMKGLIINSLGAGDRQKVS